MLEFRESVQLNLVLLFLSPSQQLSNLNCGDDCHFKSSKMPHAEGRTLRTYNPLSQIAPNQIKKAIEEQTCRQEWECVRINIE